MGMTIKKIKQLFCFHDYQLVEKQHNIGCFCKEYYSCKKCGKTMCVKWEMGRVDDGNDDC